MATRARIAAVAQGGRFLRSVEENREYVGGLARLALGRRPDLVCLPENFTTVGLPREGAGDVAETLPGPTTDYFSALAREHRCYILCPLLTRRDGGVYNSAVLIDRSGGIAGVYDKRQLVTSVPDFTVLEGGVDPGTGDPVFDTDFGRIGVRICFDIGFPESWESLARQDARLVFWPSAYDGGFPLQVYAALHGYWVISSVRTTRSRIIDPLGRIRAMTDQYASVIWTDLNLDYAVCHYDFNFGTPDRILAAYPTGVDIQSDGEAGRFLVEPTDPSLTIDALQHEFGFETIDQYHDRHRAAYARICAGEALLPQHALHGDRKPYVK